MSAGHVELRTVIDITTLTLAERVARAEKIFIVTRGRQKVLDEIARCHASFGCVTPLCGLIYGVTGEGKSALHEHYSQDFRPFELTDGTNVPVLSVTIEAGATPKSVACGLLRQLGDPQWDKGSRGILLRKVAGLIKDCKVSLIIFDEFQHLISRETKRVMIEVADWLKTLIIETKVPVIAFGQPEALKVLANTKENEQLARRFLVREQLTSFALGSAETERDFAAFLHQFDLALPLAERSNLSRRVTRQLILEATQGRMCYITGLIKEAAWHAVSNGRERIVPDDLAFAFQRAVPPVRPEIDNPFITVEA